MKIFYPAYYQQFRCIAAACPDSCCKEWAVDVDPETAAFYRDLPGSLGDRLRAVLRDTGGGTVMTIENGRCPMWCPDGLCRIQAELGHDALCKTCRKFPRLTHNYSDFMELGLELSCPEAARLILTSSAQEILVREQAGGETPDYDADSMKILLNSRKDVLEFLENKDYSLPETLAIILLHSHAVQAQLDGGESARLDPGYCLATAKQYIGCGDWTAVFSFFLDLEILTEQWYRRLQNGPMAVCWTDPLRGLMRYMVQRYWLQAIADYDLICRVKFALVACLLVGALGGDPLETAQLFSKEIENDPDNVEKILDGAYTAQAFTDVNLIGLLLS